MSTEKEMIATPSYALTRLRKALETARSHSDSAVRERALGKVSSWSDVIDGMVSGRITVGSRTPVADTPAWVTLEVAHGGFATGKFLAEGPLQEHEVELLSELEADVPGDTERAKLNFFFLGDTGLRKLSQALKTGSYTVSVPEEGALMAVVWLLDNGLVIEALSLIETLQPLMHRLRFYPKFESSPQPPSNLVCRALVGEVYDELAELRTSPSVQKMREALAVWNPLLDRLLSLWLETVEGEPPDLQDRRVVGGRPGERIPDGWAERREQWLSDYRRATEEHTLCGKHRHGKSNFFRLRDGLEKFDQERPEGRALGLVRLALANEIARRGLPDSQQRQAVRAEQAGQLDLPTKREVTSAILKDLAEYPRDGGLADIEPFLKHCNEKFLDLFESKLALALQGTVEELIEREVITGPEVLAGVLPQLTAEISAAGIEDPALSTLFSQIYSAFRKRRSLLLLNLESQVRLEELPWVEAISAARQSNLATVTVARQALENLTLLTLTHFPQTILPNRMISELQSLMSQAGLPYELTEELAADIFMGRFGRKWWTAGSLALEWLEGSFYSRYYDLDVSTEESFSIRCERRSKEAGTEGSWVSRNGAMIEQSQILTTHNLVHLVFCLNLQEQFRDRAVSLASKVFRFVVKQQVRPVEYYHLRLLKLKNTAYAWRQGIFFFSLATPAEQGEVLDELQALVSEQDPEWQARFQPAVDGLWHIYGGGRFDNQGIGRENRSARRLLGWSCGAHWLDPEL